LAVAADTGSPVKSISIQRLLARNVARQRHHRRRTEQADVDAGRCEARGFRGNRQIAARDQLAAGGGRDALHGGDNRLRQVHDRLHHGAAGIHDLGKVGAATVGIAAARGQFLHVVAGGKCRAVGRDHDCADRLVVVNFLQRIVECRDQAFRQAVARRRPIEREHGDAADFFTQEDRRLRCWCAGGLGGHLGVSKGFQLGFCDNLL
jgi:hypothetical protein